MIPRDSYVSGKFIHDGKPLEDAPEWGMSLRSAGSMRFRWNEENLLRNEYLSELAGTDHEIVPVELIHSKTVYTVDSLKDTLYKTGDGIITRNRNVIPVITAADCMPIFIFDMNTGVFGSLHSGWKGTGIVETAILQAQRDFGSVPSDFCVVMAPHIHKCCYHVDKERSEYFRNSFACDCITESGDGNYSLSLAKANLSVLEKIGVKKENIFISSDCTCCDEKYGSFRREAVAGKTVFTVQAAWLKW